MKPVVGKAEPAVTIRAVSGDEEGRKRVQKSEHHTHNIDKLKYIEKKLVDKGVRRLERHPRDGLPLEKQPKSGHGGKYTWEGPAEEWENELEAEEVIDEKDPNYVDEEAEERVVRGEESGAAGVVVGEVEVPKVAEEGVARIEVDPHLRLTE
ncbi:hypothetical protein LguiA_005085 [Lonicera macranthoides]